MGVVGVDVFASRRGWRSGFALVDFALVLEMS